ncbi:nicotinamide riboside kinase 1 isoform X3 [Dromiciops gliroides]|uniref:nicotinamide riboside kinase 1 isoform X3 n=1 Tax=Dromiciops gliroides TaxID=33562 RepID=UPI001CC406FA|nr:nicotinamide riboside kinase 1 isoform X3 [Dromiciops gliroides]
MNRDRLWRQEDLDSSLDCDTSWKTEVIWKHAMKAFVVGISGVTNGGKTTLAKKLQKQLPNCSVISQDDYFKPESEIKIDENGFLQYDELEALNMETLMSAVHSWIKNPRNSLKSDGPEGAEEVPILIIEGFLLYNYNTRVYEPPDPPGYFDKHVWPMYLKHRKEIEGITRNIVYLDGTKSEEDLFLRVYNDLIEERAKQKCLQKMPKAPSSSTSGVL